jgi:hypothetical protein
MLNLEMDLELRFKENFESNPIWTWSVNHWFSSSFFLTKNRKQYLVPFMVVPTNASTIPITISFSCFVSICTQYVGTKMGVVSFVPFLLTFPWFSCKSGIWNYSKTTKHKIIMPFRQIATKRCNILGNSSLSLCH